MSERQKIFVIVFLVHLGIVGLIVTFSLISSRDYYTNPVTAVDVVEPVELSPIPEEEPSREESEPAEEMAVEEEIVVEKKPEEPIEEEEKPTARKKVTRKIRTLKPATSDLKNRLRKRLKGIETQSRPADQPRRVRASGEKRFPFSWYEEFIHSKIYSLWRRPTG